jgi:hypothetical protein
MAPCLTVANLAAATALEPPPQMTSLPLLVVPVDGVEFLVLDAVVLALDDWAVKEKFVFRCERRDSGRALWVCAEEDCSWRCRASLLAHDNVWELAVASSEHSCGSRATRKFSSASKKGLAGWRGLPPPCCGEGNYPTADHRSPPRTIRREIDYKRAQECRLRLLDGDIGKQRNSFQLLPTYKELASPSSIRSASSKLTSTLSINSITFQSFSLRRLSS